MSEPWPDEPGYPRDLFAGTAEFYARYRPGYPADLIQSLTDTADPSCHDQAVDLACGTGHVALRLAPFLRRVLAIDQEPEMVAVGRELAAERHLTNIDWRVAAIEDVEIAADSVDLVTIGNAFHRVPRPRVARAAYGWLRHGGAFADLGSSALHAGPEPWQRLVADAIRRWTAPQPERRQQRRTSAEVLEDAGFTVVRYHEREERRRWSLDEVIGFLFSTSVASRRALGPAAGSFESELRAALLALDPSGLYEETMSYYAVLARKE